MIDVQNQPGLNNMDVDKVGICDVNYPIEVLDKKNEKQGTTTLGDVHWIIALFFPTDLAFHLRLFFGLA